MSSAWVCKLFRQKFCAVEFFRELQHGGVAMGLDGVENGACVLLDHGVEEAGRRGDFAQAFGEILVRVADDFHAGRLRDAVAKVKITRRTTA